MDDTRPTGQDQPDKQPSLVRQTSDVTPAGQPPAGRAVAGQKSLAQLQSERQAKIDQLRTREDNYEQYDDDQPKKRSFLRSLARFLGWMLLVVVLTGAGAGAAWYFWLRKEAPAASQSSQQAQPAPPPAPPAQEQALATESFTSNQFQMEFSYPQGWTAREGTDNKVTVTSAPTKLKTVSGQQAAGQIIMTIQHKQSSLPDFAKGAAQAVRESDKMSYAKPSQTQRAQTYLSFLSYAGTAGKGLDAIYITGDNGYQTNQEVPMADIAKADPLITVSFRGCQDSKCAVPDKPLTLPANSWEDKDFSRPILTMLQSIVVQ